MKLQLLSAVLCFMGCTALAQNPVINEFTASNKSNNTDAFNEYEDWIEIYNPSASTLDLSGWHLSDKDDNPTKYTVPAGVTIPAGGRRVFYCSDRNMVQGGQYHTNFKLTQTKGDWVILANAAGTIVDSLHLNANRYTQKNHSYARTTDGAATWGVATTPTANAANANVKPYYAAKPTASIQGGFHPGTISVTLTTTAPNSDIRYTTDGSEPSIVSTLYTGAISVTTTQSIRARTFSNTPNVPPSFIETNTYIITTTHTLPTVCLNGNFNSLFNNNTGELQHAIEYYDETGALVFKTEGDMKGHGNDSWAFPQKGMRFYTRDEYGFSNNIDAQIFTTTQRNEFDVLIIKAAGSDNYPCASNMHGLPSCHLRDAYAQTISDKYNLNVDERSYRPIVVYINGQYWGLYEFRERVDADFTDYYYNQPKGKVDMLAYWGWLQLDEGTDAGWDSLYNYMMNNDLSIQANYDYVVARFDPMSLIDYFILNTYTVNSDWLNWNTAWWRGKKDPIVRWRYHLWDMDNTFDLGQNYTGLPSTGYENDPCSAEELFENDPDIPHTGMFNKLLENDGFKTMYINRYADLINTAFNCVAMNAHLDSLVALLAPEMPMQCQRWNGTMNEWGQHIQYMRDQINGRCAAIQNGMTDCYDLTGPYQVTILVDPPQSGNNVQLNTIIPQSYPYTGSYYGNNGISLTALPAVDYNFQFWEPVGSSTVTPNITAPGVAMTFTGADTIIAHFKKIFVQGIDEDGATFGMSVFPSPTSGNLTISLNRQNIKPMALNIYSATGSLVYAQKNVTFNTAGMSAQYVMDAEKMGLKPGVYFIRLDDGQTPAVARFVYQPE